MAREDKILKAFLSDPIIKDKYGVDIENYQTIGQALSSNEPIVQVIAKIIQGMDSDNEMNEKAIYQQVIGYLNRSAE